MRVRRLALAAALLVAACTSYRTELPPSTPPPQPPVTTNDGRAPEKPLSPPRETKVKQEAGAALRALGYYSAPDDLASNTEAYARITDNGFRSVFEEPLSTFSADVDTASYANVRRFLQGGALPPADAVRIEELVNYFRYDGDPEPPSGQPFGVSTEVGACPWRVGHLLLRVGLRAQRIANADVPPRNLVFLIDVSGSMMPANKLPLLKSAMALLVTTLREQDRVALVVYAGAAGLALPSTSGAEKARILAALESLSAGGSTAGGAGIKLAYQVAQEARIDGGVNRVILATDGDFNVGVSSPGELVRMIEEKRRTGVSLTVLGFGMGNLKDATLEQLADKGDGNYAYVDSLAEARKVLVDEAGGTLVTVARDVKLQVEFNPAAVAGYRLVGYENRLLAKEDFNDDTKDAGDIGSGHTVTALYELVPAGVKVGAAAVDPLRYQQPRTAASAATSGELATVKVRFKDPGATDSRLASVAVRTRDAALSTDFRFAAAVAEFGMLLRGSEHRGDARWAHVADVARATVGVDRGGYRREFVSLVERAAALQPSKVTSAE